MLLLQEKLRWFRLALGDIMKSSGEYSGSAFSFNKIYSFVEGFCSYFNSLFHVGHLGENNLLFLQAFDEKIDTTHLSVK